MRSQALSALFLVSAAIRSVSAQSSTACNNSPDLCSRQYNNITYLGTHNAPFLRDASTDYSTSGNQFYNTSAQLSAGVRLLTAQVQTPDNSTSLHVCHTSCSLLDAGTLSSWLSEVKTWLDSNANEVVTILLVNGASASASDLAAAYTSAGLDSYSYTPAVTSASSTWPTLESLISNGTRAMNFVATLDDNSAAPYLMNEFTYIVENSYENTAPTDYSCDVDRPSSLANQTASAMSQGYMTLMNHFLYEQQIFNIQSPNESYAPTTNAPSGGTGNLGDSADECTTAYGKAPNFLLVDFFNMGPSISTADRLNGLGSATARLSLPATAPDESTASISIPRTSTVYLGLSSALVAFFSL
ncbi:uncharacterized protein MYCFIDRAFT_33704 [Pseudocercospora fijiensis CIRAD86]|uniref:PLC-like phosphodiesterase n=1 Tax=Pseudocercospora fijiensis (strain CIRAD86) TaxID=383855 RepID=M3B5R4_PSEFD|nr:uncharacterized protein MYCFIDRAFT_33704 [Pseudocercospora fijiensis CIRAD86]EME84702.1 hypothetical protein MYCFIDRAFT_33704 [Pseudocercospora fijiensis CIRAD86]